MNIIGINNYFHIEFNDTPQDEIHTWNHYCVKNLWLGSSKVLGWTSYYCP